VNVSMVISGVEIIPPSEARDAWHLALLIRACLAQGTPVYADLPYIEQVQRVWLKLPSGTRVWNALVYFILALDASVDDGIFSEDPRKGLHALAKRASEILAKSKPAAFIREQVLYAAGIKKGPRPADLPILKGGTKEGRGLDSIVRRKDGKRVAAAHETASLNIAIAVDLGLSLKDLENLVAKLESGEAEDSGLTSTKQKKLAEAIKSTVLSGSLAPNGADKHYQRLHRNRQILKKMAERLKAAKERVGQIRGTSLQTVIGERILAASSAAPVHEPGSMTHAGVTYKPAHIDLDENKPTAPQIRPKKSHRERHPSH